MSAAEGSSLGFVAGAEGLPCQRQTGILSWAIPLAFRHTLPGGVQANLPACVPCSCIASLCCLSVMCAFAFTYFHLLFITGSMTELASCRVCFCGLRFASVWTYVVRGRSAALYCAGAWRCGISLKRLIALPLTFAPFSNILLLLLRAFAANDQDAAWAWVYVTRGWCIRGAGPRIALC